MPVDVDVEEEEEDDDEYKHLLDQERNRYQCQWSDAMADRNTQLSSFAALEQREQNSIRHLDDEFEVGLLSLLEKSPSTFLYSDGYQLCGFRSMVTTRNEQ